MSRKKTNSQTHIFANLPINHKIPENSSTQELIP